MSEPVSDAELRDYETLLREGRSVGEEDWCDEPMTRLIAEVRRLREREDANFKLLESVKEWFPPEHYAAITAENDRLRQQMAALDALVDEARGTLAEVARADDLTEEGRRKKAQYHYDRIAAKHDALGQVAGQEKLREAALNAITVLESVLFDEQTQEAGLWRGPMIPRAIGKLTAALGGPASPLELPAEKPLAWTKEPPTVPGMYYRTYFAKDGSYAGYGLGTLNAEQVAEYQRVRDGIWWFGPIPNPPA